MRAVLPRTCKIWFCQKKRKFPQKVPVRGDRYERNGTRTSPFLEVDFINNPPNLRSIWYCNTISNMQEKNAPYVDIVAMYSDAPHWRLLDLRRDGLAEVSQFGRISYTNARPVPLHRLLAIPAIGDLRRKGRLFGDQLEDDFTVGIRRLRRRFIGLLPIDNYSKFPFPCSFLP